MLKHGTCPSESLSFCSSFMKTNVFFFPRGILVFVTVSNTSGSSQKPQDWLKIKSNLVLTKGGTFTCATSLLNGAHIYS